MFSRTAAAAYVIPVTHVLTAAGAQTAGLYKHNVTQSYDTIHGSPYTKEQRPPRVRPPAALIGAALPERYLNGDKPRKNV